MRFSRLDALLRRRNSMQREVVPKSMPEILDQAKVLQSGPGDYWQYPGPPDSPRDGFAQKPGGAPDEPWIVDSNYRPTPGTQFDLIGPLWGSFLSPKGVPFDQRALPPSALLGAYHVFTVGDDSLPNGWRLELGPVAPRFEQVGGGMQIKIHPPVGFESAYRTTPIEYLKQVGFLK